VTGDLIYLASRSARRRQLLALANVRFDVIDIEIDESPHEGEEAAAYVQRVADEKAAAGWTRVLAEQRAARPVLAADTAVVVEGRILGKPRDAAEARGMLQTLSGKDHEVLTAVSVKLDRREERFCSRSRVRFGLVSDGEIDDYVASGEPMDKAGAYAIQGAAQRFIERVDGSVSGIMGLPLYETLQLLSRFGVTCRTPSM
jgi:septum formation protein